MYGIYYIKKPTHRQTETHTYKIYTYRGKIQANNKQTLQQTFLTNKTKRHTYYTSN